MRQSSRYEWDNPLYESYDSLYKWEYPLYEWDNPLSYRDNPQHEWDYPQLIEAHCKTMKTIEVLNDLVEFHPKP